jgi:hypothetical protein
MIQLDFGVTHLNGQKMIFASYQRIGYLKSFRSLWDDNHTHLATDETIQALSGAQEAERVLHDSR